MSYGDAAAIDDVSLCVQKGERWAVVGASGSGKSTFARALLGFSGGATSVTGHVQVVGVDVLSASTAQLRGFRGAKVALIMQGSAAALDPLQRVGSALVESIRAHQTTSQAVARDVALRALASASLPDPVAIFRAFPHQLSGGQRQRVCIAMAIAMQPQVLVADEPTSALDRELGATIAASIRDLCRKRSMTLVFVTHDLSIAQMTCDHVAVMERGKIIESGALAEVSRSPQQEHTRQLIRASAMDLREAAHAAAKASHVER